VSAARGGLAATVAAAPRTARDPVLVRASFRFSAGGAHAACLAGSGDGDMELETWSFTGATPSWRRLALEQPVTLSVQPLPLDDGRVLLCRNTSGHSHQVSLVEPDAAGGARERVLAMMACRGLRLLSGPGAEGDGSGTGTDPAPPAWALAIALDDRGRSTIWRVSERRPWLERLIEIPGLLLGGVWLDPTGALLGVDRMERLDGGPAKAVAVDLRDGSWSVLLDVGERSNDRLLLASPSSGLLVVSTDAPGETRLGWARVGHRPVRFPPALRRLDARPLATDPEGRRVLLKLDAGVRSRLASYDPAADRLAPLDIPDGHVRNTACWTPGLLRFPLSAPAHPTAVATVDLARGGCTVDGLEAGPAGWVGAHVERLEGAAGPVEAIVYGGRDWRASERVLLALHGGPLDAWRLEFDPLFQVLARAGIAVVAPNQRGSSCYGPPHALAIRGAWGGPDLDDVRRIAYRIAAERGRLGVGVLGDMALLGLSYGAFLALLAASSEPELWSRCVALAPFVSGQRLYRDGAPAVRGLLERLGGCQELHDALGPRDLLRLAPRLRARLLLIHGSDDEVIPVGHSRALRRRLLELGRRDGADLDYLEVPGGGHDLVTTAGTPALRERILRFLIDERPSVPPGIRP
jgi:pimeloyl-ACP methyl ester carboxylesterase